MQKLKLHEACHFREIRGKIKIVSTHYLFCRKFTAVCYFVRSQSKI